VLKKRIKTILDASRNQGWVLEPDTKDILKASGLAVPTYVRTDRVEDAVDAAESIGYPVVGKVVSPGIIHKSNRGGVIVGIDSRKKVTSAFRRFSKLEGFSGMLVEATVSGVELIVGAKMDYQFGPVLLLGIGGTGVEIYQDTSLRMAPIAREDVVSMINGLKAHEIIEGYRGSSPVSLDKLSETLLAFSDLVMDLDDRFESIDLNPVICSPDACIVADARIVLKRNDEH
jgi:succinyl-CoA synthetase beta subunit